MSDAWRRIPYVAVGGLTAVGFGRQAQLLLVVSHQGSGGFRNARDVVQLLVGPVK